MNNQTYSTQILSKSELSSSKLVVAPVSGQFLYNIKKHTNCNSKFSIDEKSIRQILTSNISDIIRLDFRLNLSSFDSNFIKQGLDDKTKFLHNIQRKILKLFDDLNQKRASKPPLQPIEYSSSTRQQTRSFVYKSKSLSRLTCLEVPLNDVKELTQSCSNIHLNSYSELLTRADLGASGIEQMTQKSRPSYIIERDCHVFGGCVDDDAEDEFFISSGAVYQSWPYVYEPGYQMEPLPQTCPNYLSVSDEQIDYSREHEQNSLFVDQPNELPSYSLDNYGINLFHIESQQKHKKTRRKRQHNGSYILSTSSSYFDSDMSSDESSDDDSDSYRAYKQRHAIGLNSFNAYHSQSSLSELSHRMGQFKTNLFHTDSSSCDEYSRKSMLEKNSVNPRLATSFNTRDADRCFGDLTRHENIFGKAKFLSRNQSRSSNSNKFIF